MRIKVWRGKACHGSLSPGLPHEYPDRCKLDLEWRASKVLNMARDFWKACLHADTWIHTQAVHKFGVWIFLILNS